MRECAQCGKTYSRRDQIEVWTGRNPGHRTGWRKEILKRCLHCASPESSRRILMLASVRLGGRTSKRKQA